MKPIDDKGVVLVPKTGQKKRAAMDKSHAKKKLGNMEEVRRRGCLVTAALFEMGRRISKAKWPGREVRS